MNHRFSGFTLIELMVALAIFGLLLMLAGPQYAQFMANHQIRNAADAMLNGVQQAQGAAVRGNTVARLVVDTTTGTGGWQVFQTIDGKESKVQGYTVRDGAPQASMAPVPADATQVTFDGFGRMMPKNVDDSSPLRCIKVSHSLSGSRSLNVAISSTGLGVETRLCDPNVNKDLPPGDPLICPGWCT